MHISMEISTPLFPDRVFQMPGQDKIQEVSHLLPLKMCFKINMLFCVIIPINQTKRFTYNT